MSSIPTRPASLSTSAVAPVVLHGGFVIAGVVTPLTGPILPILIGRWSLSDQRAGLFFTAQFCGSMAGVASLGWLIQRGYQYALVCGFSLIAGGGAGINLYRITRPDNALPVQRGGMGLITSLPNIRGDEEIHNIVGDGRSRATILLGCSITT